MASRTHNFRLHRGVIWDIAVCERCAHETHVPELANLMALTLPWLRCPRTPR